MILNKKKKIEVICSNLSLKKKPPEFQIFFKKRDCKSCQASLVNLEHPGRGMVTRETGQ